MLWCHEEDRVGYPDPLAELRPYRRRIIVTVLIVNRQVSDFDDTERQRSGPKFNKRIGHFSVDRAFPKTSD